MTCACCFYASYFLTEQHAVVLDHALGRRAAATNEERSTIFLDLRNFEQQKLEQRQSVEKVQRMLQINDQ